MSTLFLDVIGLIIGFTPMWFFLYYILPILFVLDDRKMKSFTGQVCGGVLITWLIVMYLWAITFFPGDTHIVGKLMLSVAISVVIGFFLSDGKRHEKRIAVFCEGYPEAAKAMLKDSKIPAATTAEVQTGTI